MATKLEVPPRLLSMDRPELLGFRNDAAKTSNPHT